MNDNDLSDYILEKMNLAFGANVKIGSTYHPAIDKAKLNFDKKEWSDFFRAIIVNGDPWLYTGPYYDEDMKDKLAVKSPNSDDDSVKNAEFQDVGKEIGKDSSNVVLSSNSVSTELTTFDASSQIVDDREKTDEDIREDSTSEVDEKEHIDPISSKSNISESDADTILNDVQSTFNDLEEASFIKSEAILNNIETTYLDSTPRKFNYNKSIFLESVRTVLQLLSNPGDKQVETTPEDFMYWVSYTLGFVKYINFNVSRKIETFMQLLESLVSDDIYVYATVCVSFENDFDFDFLLTTSPDYYKTSLADLKDIKQS